MQGPEQETTTQQAKNPIVDGFVYHEDFLTERDELELLEIFGKLDFGTVAHNGPEIKRKMLAYGWTYDLSTNELWRASDIPLFLLPIRNRAAQLAGIPVEGLEEALLTLYPPGAPLIWHRDHPMFEKIIGISLQTSCTMEMKPYQEDEENYTVILEPRSLYILQGEARWRYQHSIQPVTGQRYSITFRTLR